MSNGSANSMPNILRENPLNLSEKDWIRALESEKGIYNPLLKNEVEFNAAGLLGPTLNIKDGVGIIHGDAGNKEIMMLNVLENNRSFFEKLGREVEKVGEGNYTNSRGGALMKMTSGGIKGKGDRILDYTLVALGALKPWARKLDNIIKDLENKSIKNKSDLVKQVRDNIKKYPSLKRELERRWKNSKGLYDSEYKNRVKIYLGSE